MLGAVDTIKRSIKVPSKFIPYMEKHRLYELFQEFAIELIIKKPQDHILYLKQCLQHAVKKRDFPRIIIFAPPEFDKMHLAKMLQEEIGVYPVTLSDIYKSNNVSIDDIIDAEELAQNVKKYLITNVNKSSNWIFVDIPRTKSEARAIQRIGIIPTHVINITTSGKNTCDEFKLSRNRNLQDVDEYEQRMFKKHIRGLRDAYSDLLIEIETGNRTIEELSKACVAVTKIRKHCVAPCNFRILLIGAYGFNTCLLVKQLLQKFDFVHVDFHYILKQTCLQETTLGRTLQMIEKANESYYQLTPEIRFQVVKQYLLKYECMKKGWILTGYPVTVEDFKLLDMFSTPPNRVIFVGVKENDEQEKAKENSYVLLNKNEYYLLIKTDSEDNYTCSETDIHMKNIERHEENIKAMLKYADKSATIIDGNDEEKVITERIEACLMRPAPCAPPRISKSPRFIDPQEIEYDPDDEPDSHIFNNIRECESI